MNKSKEERKIQNDAHDIRVITFNLLSQGYVTKKFYPYVPQHYLDPVNRMQRMKKLLDSWTKVNFIICLQEMDETWFDMLKPLFSTKSYGFYSIQYADKKMGQGIAYPMKHFDLIEADYFVPGEFVKSTICDKLKFGSGVDTNDPPIDHEIVSQLSEASESKNVMVSVGLNARYFGKLIGKKIIISTYHMPCKYKDHYFVASHIHALKVRLSELMKRWDTGSLVLAGDFNIVNTGPMYEYLTKSCSNDSWVHGFDNVYKLAGHDTREVIQLKSAHFVCNKKEPDYTNVSIQEKSKFIGTLDYILISHMVNVRSCTVGLVYHDKNKLNTGLNDEGLVASSASGTSAVAPVVTHVTPQCPIYPNGICPSDHLPLSASLFIT